MPKKLKNKILVNLSNYECIPTDTEYNKIYNRIKKIIIPNKMKSSKLPACKIFTGPPGSGKSRLADVNKINIDIDKITDLLFESQALENMGVKHGNVIDSCGDVASRISDDLINVCVRKQYSFSMHTLYGLQLEFLYFLREHSYRINAYYVYAYNAYNNNVKRKNLNLSKKVYSGIIKDMYDIQSLFATYSVSDTFEFIHIKKHEPKFEYTKTRAKDWNSTKFTIIQILNKIKHNIK